jgi:TIR domain
MDAASTPDSTPSVTPTSPSVGAPSVGAPVRVNDLFISYSRQDTAFVRELDAALRRHGRDPWVDWEDIYEGEEWRRAIAQGIEAADAMVFVISPDSVASVECGKELAIALEDRKRIIPLLRREAAGVDPALGDLNWIYFREQDDFEAAVGKLLAALERDLSHVRMHTRLLGWARHWEQGRDDGSLLRGQDLVMAEQWLAAAVGKEPEPTALHRQYVGQSRVVLAAAERLVAAGRRAQRIVGYSAVLAGGVVLAAVGATALVAHRAQEQVAQLNGVIAERQRAIAVLDRKQVELEADRQVLIAQLKKFGFTDAGIEALLASPPEEFERQVQQVQQANAGYTRVEQMLKERGLVAAKGKAASESGTPESGAAPESGVPPADGDGTAGAPPDGGMGESSSGASGASSGASSMPAPAPAPAPAPTPMSTPAPTPMSTPKPTPKPMPNMAAKLSPRVVVEYYPKEIDAAAFERILSKFGYELRIGKPEVTDTPINVIFYGAAVPEEDVKLVAFTLMRAGVQLRAIQPFRRLAKEKARVIQVGALRELRQRPVLAAERVLAEPLPLPR